MKLVQILLLAVLIPASSYAQGAPDIDTTLPIGNGKWLSSRSANGQTENRLLGSDSSNNTVLNVKSGSAIVVAVDKTPTGVELSADGIKAPVAPVITPATAATAVAAAPLTYENSVIAAGAPTLALVQIPAATASVGKKKNLLSLSSNPVAIVPAGGAINAFGALTPFICAAGKVCKCEGMTTGIWGCGSLN